MFILYCASDNSYSLVENEKVIFDEENIEKGDEVIFTYNNKEYTRKVIDYSDNKCYLEKQYDKLKLQEKGKKGKQLNKTEKFLRKRKETESSPSLRIPSKVANTKSNTKQVLKNIQRTSNSAFFDVLNKYNSKLSHNNASNSNNHASSNTIDLSGSSTIVNDSNTSQDNKRMDHSPTKEDLKKMLFEARKELKERSYLKEINKDSCLLNPENNNNFEMDTEMDTEIINPLENIDNNTENLENEIEEFEDTGIQLYGKNFEPKMVHLKNNFYCRNAIYYAALENSHRSSQMARRLVTGVFKKEALINCTLTGQTPRTQGKDRQNVKVSCLHPLAINALVDFSLDYGIKHGWTIQTKKDLY